MQIGDTYEYKNVVTKEITAGALGSGGLDIFATPFLICWMEAAAYYYMKEQLPEAFSDFAPYLGKCQFPDCAHLKEPGCAVRAALEQGKIEPTRYDSYRRLYELAKDIKPWELKERGN